MNIYVDKMPKSCAECPCCNECMDYGDTCKLTKEKVTSYVVHNFKPKHCPLKLLPTQMSLPIDKDINVPTN